TSDGVFRVKEVRNYIDDIFLASQVIDTRWVRFVPIKQVLRRICRWWELDPSDWNTFQENVGRSQPKDTFWHRVLNEFNRLNFQKRTKDMLSSKWNTLNHNCQKFNAIYKRCSRFTKSGESELDVMKQAWAAYRDENKNFPFPQEDAWEVLRKHAKWDAPAPAPAPVDLTEDEEIADVNTDELFGDDPRPRPSGKQSPGKKQNPIHR
nr:hypothetical protein [Tanacetum cinerariifolium]